jgi:hypothetical protein
MFVLVLQCFLLLEAVDLHGLEVGSDAFVLALSKKEEAGLLFVDTGHHPLLVTNIVVYFLAFVSDSCDHHQS